MSDTTSPARRSVRPGPRPGFAVERELWADGATVVAGMDEVGRGAWAGPVSVGVAVIRSGPPRLPTGLRDSKLLDESRREQMAGVLRTWCAAWAVGHAGPEECDAFGMTAACRIAARRALAQLPPALVPDAIVLDGIFDYVGHPRVRTVIGGDRVCASVAAASVLAKVTRDRYMREVASSFPPFDFHRNKGYPSPDHRRALTGYGLTSLHRRSWSFVDDLVWSPQWAGRPARGSVSPARR